jgi:hypothetical protein
MEGKEGIFTIELVDGIMIGRYHAEYVDLEIAKEAFETGVRMTKGKKHPSIADISRVIKFTQEAREFLARKEAYDSVIAGVLIVKSIYQKVGGNLYLLFSKQPIPTKLFTYEKNAIEWLQQFK